jgi:hypothetical protein
MGQQTTSARQSAPAFTFGKRTAANGCGGGLRDSPGPKYLSSRGHYHGSRSLVAPASVSSGFGSESRLPQFAGDGCPGPGEYEPTTFFGARASSSSSSSWRSSSSHSFAGKSCLAQFDARGHDWRARPHGIAGLQGRGGPGPLSPGSPVTGKELGHGPAFTIRARTANGTAQRLRAAQTGYDTPGPQGYATTIIPWDGSSPLGKRIGGGDAPRVARLGGFPPLALR